MASSGIQPDQHYLVQNAIEKIGKEYLNKNVEIDTRTTNNRLLLLCEDQYHGDLLASVLEGSKDEVRTMLIGDFANSEILLKIKFTKMLVVGNMTPDDAVQIGRQVAQVLGLNGDNQDYQFNETRGCKVAKISPGEVIEWDSKH